MIAPTTRAALRTLALLTLAALPALPAGCMVGDEPDLEGTAGANLGGETSPDTDRARVCASGATVKGIDVSTWQGTIDWPRVKASGVAFAFIRVSDGGNTRDARFATNWAKARSAGVIRGAYQFFRPAQSASAQAQLLIDAVGGAYTPGDLPPVIDVEDDGGLAPATVAARVRAWVDKVQAALGVAPIVYTGKYFWRDEVGGPASFAGNPLWVAQYTTLCPDLPAPWGRWTFWQHSASGTVPGISEKTDLDRFNGSLADLQAFAQAAGGTPPPSPPPPAGASCRSATLGRDVAHGGCVQAASDRVWYQCNDGTWDTPVSRTTWTGPAGACTETHPL